MTKGVHKAITKRSSIKNKLLKDRTETNQEKFKLQINSCKKLLRTTKISYYSNLDIKKLQITKRPLKGEKINLLENDKNISNDTELCNIFNFVFSLILFSNLTSLKSIIVF